MADISKLSRIVSGISRNVSIQDNTLVVGSLKVGTTEPLELTKALVGVLAGADARITTAQSTADTALANAATADGKAVTAQSTADTALANAATADSKAVTADGKAVTAQSTADTALANAATADGKAVTAQDTADTALANAATADSKAVTADGKAVTAQTAIDNHISALSGAHAASAILVADAGDKFAATNVEGVLAELDGRIGSAIVGAIIYKSTFDASAGNFDAIVDPKQGWMYKVGVAGIISGVSFNVNDNMYINKDVTGSPVIGDIDLIDNTESTDILRTSDIGISVASQSAVEAAQTAADAADGKAVTAQSTADQAILDAEDAQGTADTALNNASAAQTAIDNHISALSGAHAASAILVADAGDKFAATEVEGVLAELDASISQVSTAAQGLIQVEADARVAADEALDTRVTILEGGTGKVFVLLPSGGVSAGDIVYVASSGKVLPADSDAEATCTSVIGIADAAVADGSNVKVQVAGTRAIKNANFSGNIGKRVYVSGTAGEATVVAPEANDSVVFLIGHSVSNTEIVIQPHLEAING
jgi:hypothetical protein